MTIESKHFYPAPVDFESFFEVMSGVSWVVVIELAKLDNEAGKFNQERLRFWTHAWNRYCNLTGRQQEIVMRESASH